ncbi:MAG: hypothetical protein, partial [Olavius algarvensis Gamma 1 endosymbiont]
MHYSGPFALGRKGEEGLNHSRHGGHGGVRVSPCSGCETGHPSPPFALRSGDNLYVPRT